MVQIDPSLIRTSRDLAEQLAALFDEDPRGMQRFAADAGLGQATVHALVNGTTEIPRIGTLERFVRACGRDPGPWRAARARLVAGLREERARGDAGGLAEADALALPAFRGRAGEGAVMPLGVLLIGRSPAVEEVERLLERHPRATVVERAQSAEYSFEVMRRMRTGTAVDAIFIDPLADTYDPHQASLLILETRLGLPDIAFALLVSQPVLDRAKHEFPSELRSRLDHYYRVDTDLEGVSLAQSVDAAVDRCLAWREKSGRRRPSSLYEYDVALSFSGAQRDFAEELATLLRMRGVRVFYDDDERPRLWGKNLYTTLSEIYTEKARYCIILASSQYRENMWAVHERSAAQARALASRDAEYILPIRFDDSVVPGLPHTVAYLPSALGAAEIAEIFIRKLGSVM